MNKKSTSGGGHSSLGYLFGSDESEKQQNDQSKKSSPPVCMPPYGIDNFEDKPLKKASTPATKKDDSTSLKNYVYHGDGDKSTGFLVTVSFYFYTYQLKWKTKDSFLVNTAIVEMDLETIQNEVTKSLRKLR